MTSQDFSALKTFAAGVKTERKNLFGKMFLEAKKYKEPDQLLQAKTILLLQFEVKSNEFSSTVKAMVKLLKLYPSYREPATAETLRSAALSIIDVLCRTLRESAFASLMSRATELALSIVTTRTLPPPVEELDLSDMEDIPLSTNAKFSTHRTALLEEKDGMLEHKAVDRRIETLISERTVVREWTQQERDNNKDVAAGVVKTYANKDISSCDALKTQQYLLKCLKHRINILQAKPATEPKRVEVRAPSSSSTATATESATLLPSEPEVQKYHSSGALMPPPPESGLGKDHPYDGKVVNTAEVQLVQPRVPHPVTTAHASACMSIVNEIEQMPQNKDYNININVTDKLSLWLCPPGFSWSLTFDSLDKRKQAFEMAKKATEILNMRIRREARARDMAQRRMDTSAKGTFDCFKYDIEREFQLLKQFRRDLFYIELGPTAAAQLEGIKRLEQASVNTGITASEQMLFKKLMKAKLQAVVDAVSSPKKPTKTKNRNKCNYCKKRHAGGPSNCRKRKADEKAKAAAANKPTPAPRPTPTRNKTTTTTISPVPPKRRKVTVAKAAATTTEDP